MEAAAAQAPPWTKSPGGRDRLSAARNAVKTLVQEQQLNPSQGAAVTAALTRTVTLWQGPPGTGKVSNNN
jgi:regulator of nonsense transcripts 1